MLNSQVLERGRISESHLKSENSASTTGNAVVCEEVFDCFVLISLKEPASSLKFKWAKTWSRLKIDSLRCWLSASSSRNSSSSARRQSRKSDIMRDFSLPCKRVKLKRRLMALINAERNGPLQSNDIPDGKEPKIDSFPVLTLVVFSYSYAVLKLKRFRLRIVNLSKDVFERPYVNGK